MPSALGAPKQVALRVLLLDLVELELDVPPFTLELDVPPFTLLLDLGVLELELTVCP